MVAFPRTLLAVIVLVLLAVAADAKKKRIKTTFKELKCSSCKVRRLCATGSVTW